MREIERRWWLKEIPDISNRVYTQSRVYQRYIRPGVRMRRVDDEHYSLTVKIGPYGNCEEYKTDITKEVWDVLSHAAEGTLAKTRLWFSEDGHTFEFDYYPGFNITILEVEFTNEDAAKSFQLPDYIRAVVVREVTGETEFSNYAIATTGWPKSVV